MENIRIAVHESYNRSGPLVNVLPFEKIGESHRLSAIICTCHNSVCTSGSCTRPNVMILLAVIPSVKWYVIWLVWVELVGNYWTLKAYVFYSILAFMIFFTSFLHVVTKYTVEVEVLCTIPFLLCAHVHTNCRCVGGLKMSTPAARAPDRLICECTAFRAMAIIS